MKLTYRGVAYDSNSPVVALNNSHPTTTNLRFRGNFYSTNLPVDALEIDNAPAQVAEPVVAEPVVMASQDRARALMVNHHRMVKKRQQVMLTRLASTIGLSSENTNYWNHIQGKVHPSFWATYGRSHVGVS